LTAGVRFSARVRNFSLLHCVQTVPEARPTSCSRDTGAVSSGVKRLRSEAGHSPPCSVEVKNGEDIPPLPPTSSWRCAWLIKHRDNVTVLTLFFCDSWSLLVSVLMSLFGMCILSVFLLTRRFDTRFDDMATMWVEVAYTRSFAGTTSTIVQLPSCAPRQNYLDQTMSVIHSPCTKIFHASFLVTVPITWAEFNTQWSKLVPSGMLC
jgi:hypothetical protein